jgi:DNA-binding CsgD family transcriptional regulator
LFHTSRNGIARGQHAVNHHLASLEEAFSSFDEAICLVGASGTVIRVSPLAREIFAGPLFAARHGVLWHADPRVYAMLLRHVATASQTGMRQATTIPAGGGVTVSIDMALAGPALSVAGERCVLLRMQRRDSGGTPPPDHDRLAAVFGITPAEARVLAALVSGQTASTYAASAGVSVNTVRKQIAMLMTKMHCNRQAELVRKAILVQG